MPVAIVSLSSVKPSSVFLFSSPGSGSGRRRTASLVVLGLVPSLVAALLSSPAMAAQAPGQRATVQQILDRPELFIDSRLARVKDVASAPQQLRTRDSRAQLLFETGAAGRLNRHSRLLLGSTCFLLEQGQVLVSGRQNGCTRSLRLSVRGTNYILETFDNGDAAVTSLEGPLEIEQLRDGEPVAQPPLILESGQRLRLLSAVGLTTVTALTPEDYRSLLEGPLFRGFDGRLPAQGALEDHLQANVPGVTLPRPPVRSDARGPAFRFGFGFGFGGGSPRTPGGRDAPSRDTPRGVPPSREVPLNY